jgi:DNA-binding transcriptional ArsR family regulator
MKNNQYCQVADILKAIGHPVRIKILESLLDHDMCVSHIGGSLHLRQSTVSQHLSLLKLKGIVKGQRCGAMVKYSVMDQRTADIIKMFSG